MVEKTKTSKTVNKTNKNKQVNKSSTVKKTTASKIATTKNNNTVKNQKANNTNKVWKIATGVLTLLLIISISMSNLNSNTTTNDKQENTTTDLSSQAVATKTIDYINKVMLQGQGVAIFKNVTDSGNMFIVKVEINGEAYDLYATKDGNMFFPQAINLDEKPQEAQASAQQTQTLNLEKSEKPVVELFIMAYCPYGTQMEKGILPVVKELGDKIDFELKFVNYAMHPSQGEVEEQLNQYCIEKDYNDKFLTYLAKFLEKGDKKAAFSEIGLTKDDISVCVEETNAKFNVTKNLEDKSSWMSGQFPKFMIHNDENLKYGVQGSPTLVINGAQAQAGRDAQSILNAICGAFINAPEECNTDMTSFGNPGPGFGYGTQGGTAASAGCEI